MKKVLFVATVVKTHIMEFHIPYLKMFKEKGWETAVAARNDYENPDDCVIPYCDTYYDIPFERSPIKSGNIDSYKQLKKIIDEGKYDIVHCHTPVGAMLARLAAIKARKNGTRVIYTAHGFHFFKGAPLLNWLVYFPVEWICSFMTDTLITINQEDYAFAQKHMHAKQIEYVPGVGIDLNKFGVSQVNPCKMRETLGIPDDKVWVLNVGELIPRKNQESLIRAIVDIPEIYLTIAGRGELQEQLTNLIAELHLEDRVKLLGYRNDISDLCQAADVFAFPSFQEGLSVALMEAMACARPIVCGAIRGNTDLIDKEGGELFDPHDVDAIRKALQSVLKRDRIALGRYNAEKIRHFDLSSVLDQMQTVYRPEIFGGGYKQVAALMGRAVLRGQIGCKATDTVLVYVAELNKNKNQESLLDMLNELLKVKDEVKLMLIGKGNLTEYLKAKARQMGIEDHVIFTGYRTDIANLLRASDIAVPSSIREGLGLNVLEAMACGLPVVAYDNRGHRSIIRVGANGFLVENGDYAAMADRVQYLMNNQEVYSRIAENGLIRVRDFGIESVMRTMERVYRIGGKDCV